MNLMNKETNKIPKESFTKVKAFVIKEAQK